MHFRLVLRCETIGTWNESLRRNDCRVRVKRSPVSWSRRSVLQISVLSLVLGRRSLAQTVENTVAEPPPVQSYELTDAEAERLMKEEEERRRQKKSRKGRLRELEETRAELAERELELFQKEQELVEKDETLLVLREELELERKIRALLTKEKEQASEEAALARGLCTGANLLP